MNTGVLIREGTMHSFDLVPIFQVLDGLMIGIEIKRQNLILKNFRIRKHQRFLGLKGTGRKETS